jgi:hypothetical protein
VRPRRRKKIRCLPSESHSMHVRGRQLQQHLLPRTRNPVCFCKYKNPNDPMCAMLSKLEENPTQDMSNSSVLISEGLQQWQGASTVSNRALPETTKWPPRLEELLAKHQAGPVGNVELQGKSGDGLGGGAGSVDRIFFRMELNRAQAATPASRILARKSMQALCRPQVLG